MTNIIYSRKITDTEGHNLSINLLKETFKGAINIRKSLEAHKKKIAYFFIDPLLNGFEAANEFYFNVLECQSIDKINTYKSGASPIQALTDAKELIDGGLYDAVFVFGHEPLLTNKKIYGKNEVTKAMNIFEEQSIIQCYNEIAHTLCSRLGLSEKEFMALSDKLFLNYRKTYQHVTGMEVSDDRGRQLDDQHGDLFKLTDCANPNIDFSGGVILVNDEVASLLQIPAKDKIRVTGANYSMVEGSPEKIDAIVGKKDNLFPHLRNAFLQAQTHSSIDIAAEFQNGNLFLEVYTCYPPVPIAFLLTTGLITNIDQLPDLLETHEMTITGGMNLARAPWNNPALNGMIDMYHKMRECTKRYGLVHGNGGIAETQGVVILEKN
ncbi:hypothetical protein [Bacillus sp. FJAT-45350]|uniref:hypothetical protein n=1 Tax=Bacillus sp. FJAT-45350 TaxID=2011014 RepID=UPI000BB84175|nr:hypothetical protein [Bacillus sp. FJAT-45350]